MKNNWERAILKVFQSNDNNVTLKTLYSQVPNYSLNSNSQDIPHTIRAYLKRLKQKNVIQQTGKSSYALMDTSIKHKNYEILNLIGYGLAKFESGFIKSFGFRTKSEFYNYIVQIGIAETVGTVKNRQDLFDPFFENKRKGWWQKGNAYIHRKILIDNLFGDLDLFSFCNIVKLFIKEKYNIQDLSVEGVSPVFKSRFKQLQMTGLEAEVYFLNNYKSIESFSEGVIEDARLFGDGYDFQVDVDSKYFLAEIKGIKTNYGGIRFTEKEFRTAREYKNDYALIVVSNLIQEPKLNLFFNPIDTFQFDKKTITSHQITYQLGAKEW